MRGDIAPLGSWTTSRRKGDLWDLGGPTGAVRKNGGIWRAKTKVVYRVRSGVGLTHITYEDTEGNEVVGGKGSAHGNATGGSDQGPDAEPGSLDVAAPVG
jgi:hypothetical protein